MGECQREIIPFLKRPLPRSLNFLEIGDGRSKESQIACAVFSSATPHRVPIVASVHILGILEGHRTPLVAIVWGARVQRLRANFTVLYRAGCRVRVRSESVQRSSQF